MSLARPRALVAAPFALAWMLSTGRAGAHEVGLSRGDYAVEGTRVRVDLAFARKELAGLVAGLDANHDGALTKAELDASNDAIQGAIVGRVKVTGDGAPCDGKLERAELAEQDGVALSALYACAKRPAEARVQLSLLDDLPFGHRHLVRATQAAGPLDLVLSQRVPGFSFAPPPAPVEPEGRAQVALRGARHVATSWPMAAFALGVLARSATRRDAITGAGLLVIAVLTGLVASAAGAFTPSPRAIAVAAALSLAYAGIDGLAARARAGVAWSALPLGVVHGLGGAVALRAAPTPLLGAFTMGALGALAATCAVLALVVVRARRARPAFGTVASAVALIAGLAALARVLMAPAAS